MKTTIKLETLPKSKLKIIYVDELRVDAIFQWRHKKSLLTWYSDYFIEFDLSYFLSDEILELLLDEMMDICANYQYCKIGG
ncbi:MAG: hypothetical protein ACI4HM_04650 [Ruminococcus sp.]